MDCTQYAGDINQALIELGSTVCKVRDPDCEACPLRPWCRAYAISKSGLSTQVFDTGGSIIYVSVFLMRSHRQISLTSKMHVASARHCQKATM